MYITFNTVWNLMETGKKGKKGWQLEVMFVFNYSADYILELYHWSFDLQNTRKQQIYPPIMS